MGDPIFLGDKLFSQKLVSYVHQLLYNEQFFKTSLSLIIMLNCFKLFPF